MSTFTSWTRWARGLLPPSHYDYIAGGADDEAAIRRNRRDFERIELRPRFLVDVSHIDTATTVLGEPVSLPVMLAPTAGHKLCCPEGELATARAVHKAGTAMVLSTLSTVGMEDVAAETAGPKWFQLYVYKDREVTRRLVQRAEASGYKALCLTVDVPVIGNRERDLRNAYSPVSSCQLPGHGTGKYASGCGQRSVGAGGLYFVQVGSRR